MTEVCVITLTDFKLVKTLLKKNNKPFLQCLYVSLFTPFFVVDGPLSLPK